MHMPYTYYNCFLMIATLRFNSLQPYLLTNSATVIIGFHCPMLLQVGFLDGLIKWNKTTPAIFWFGNFLVHGIPLIIAFMLNKKEYKCNINPGIVTALCQLLWCKLGTREGTFDLSKTYIYAKPRVWTITWIVGFLSHLIVGFLSLKIT